MRAKLCACAVLVTALAGAAWAFSTGSIPAVPATSCCGTGDCCCPGQGSCCDPAAGADGAVTFTKAASCCSTGNCCCPGAGLCCATPTDEAACCVK